MWENSFQKVDNLTYTHTLIQRYTVFLCFFFYPLWESRRPAALIIFELKTRDKEHIHTLHTQKICTSTQDISEMFQVFKYYSITVLHVEVVHLNSKRP